MGTSRIDYLISFCLPRFCDQTLARAQKEHVYPGAAPWVAKLDTIVHELYHVDPSMQGIRKLPVGKGRVATRTHSPQFFRDVTRMVEALPGHAARPRRSPTSSPTTSWTQQRFGRVTGATFRHFPSFPQRYTEVLTDQPVIEPGVRVEPVRAPSLRTQFTADDLDVREFGPRASRRVLHKRAA